jgi:hypothetical protein
VSDGGVTADAFILRDAYSPEARGLQRWRKARWRNVSRHLTREAMESEVWRRTGKRDEAYNHPHHMAASSSARDSASATSGQLWLPVSSYTPMRRKSFSAWARSSLVPSASFCASARVSSAEANPPPSSESSSQFLRRPPFVSVGEKVSGAALRCSAGRVGRSVRAVLPLE